MYAAGGGLMLRALASTPSLIWAWLPAALVTGVGVGLLLPSLSGAAVRDLPASRLGVGSAMHQSLRQLGSVAGVGVAIVLSAEPDFGALFGLVVATGAVCAAVGAFLPTSGSLSVSQVPENVGPTDLTVQTRLDVPTRTRPGQG